MNDDGFLPGFIVACIVNGFFMWWVTSNIDDSWRHQIVQHGCAEYYLDDNHDRQWRWK